MLVIQGWDWQGVSLPWLLAQQKYNTPYCHLYGGLKEVEKTASVNNKTVDWIFSVPQDVHLLALFYLIMLTLP